MSVRDARPWRNSSPERASPAGFSRRGFIRAAAGTTALALGPGLSSSALGHGAGNHRTPPPPRPIPGGNDLSGFGFVAPYDFIHVFGPGPAGLVLPFTGGQLQGLDVEPGTIADFHGATAVAYHAGEAMGSDGHTYNLETDMRVMDGRYIGVDGTARHGTFALI